MRTLLISLSLASVLLCGPAVAQRIEDPGPHPVGWQDVQFTDPVFGQGNIRGRLYYPAVASGQGAPADPGAGPYALVGFQHGFLGRPSNYDDLCSHIASWGFVVASTGTETGILPDQAQFARDTRSFLHWVDLQSQDPTSWLAGMSWGGDWAASGHSMGGGVLARLIGIEPRVRTIVGLQSASQTGSVPTQNMRAFTGSAFQVAGSVDQLVPPATVHGWFEEALSARRNVFHMVIGMGHAGCTDDPPFGEPLSGPEQARMHRRLVTGTLRAEVYGEEDLYLDLLGEGIRVEPVQSESDCAQPVFWAGDSALQPGSLAVGIAGSAGQRAALAWSLVSAWIPTRFGVLGLDPSAATVFRVDLLGARGAIEEPLPLQPGWSGRTLYLQGVAVGGAGGGLSRVVELALP